MRGLPAVSNLQHCWLLEAFFICQVALRKTNPGSKSQEHQNMLLKEFAWEKTLRATTSLWMPLVSDVFPLIMHSLPFHLALPELVFTILYPSWPFRGRVETRGTNRWAARLGGQCSVTWCLTGDWSPVELLTPFYKQKESQGFFSFTKSSPRASVWLANPNTCFIWIGCNK